MTRPSDPVAGSLRVRDAAWVRPDPMTPIHDQLWGAALAAVQTPLATGLDYSSGTIPGAQILAAGHSFVIRYVDNPHYVGTKHITPPEYAELKAAGVGVYLVFEIGTDDMLGGQRAGVGNAQRALAGARWIGYPDDQVIFMACDMHLSAGQIPTALAYVDGAASVLGPARTGVYGFWELIDACYPSGRGLGGLWQCGIAPDPTDPVHIWQRNDTSTTVGGVGCDVNDLLRPLPGGADLDANQAGQLTNIENLVTWMYGQFAGVDKTGAPAPYPTVPGWATWPNGTGENLSLLDYLRRSNVDTHQVMLLSQQIIAQLGQTPAAGGGAAPAAGGQAISDSDIAKIASAVVAAIGQHLDQAPGGSDGHR